MSSTATQRRIDWYLAKYGESHQNGTNKLIHWICVPVIMFSLLGMFFCIPFPGGATLWLNWGMVFVALAWLYYLSLSFTLFVGFVLVGGGMVVGNYYLAAATAPMGIPYIYICLGIFFLAWVFQFIGHKIEGAKPSFLEDVQFLLIGPAWLLHFIYKKIGIPY